MDLERAKTLLASPDENIVATLGTSYLQNILAGQEAKQGYAILSDKRLYYHGSNITGKGRMLKHATEDMAVSIEDISSTRFVYVRKLGLKLAGIAVAAVGLLCIVFFIIAQFTSNSGGLTA